MSTYHLKATFTTDRELTDAEVLELRKRLFLEIEEPVRLIPQDEKANISISRPAAWKCVGEVNLVIGEIYEDD